MVARENSRRDESARDVGVNRRQFFKTVAVLSGAAAAGSLMPSCMPGGAPASKGPVTVKFWKSPHHEKEADFWVPIIKQFEDAHPNIKIEFSVLPWYEAGARLTTAFASGNPPDVLYVVDAWGPKYIESKYFMDFDAAGYSKEVKDQFDAQLFAKVPNYLGKTYGIPFLGVPRFLYVNNKMLKDAGVSAPTTWDEFTKVGTSTTKGDKWGYVVFKPGYWQAFWPWLWMAGADIMNPEGTKAAFNTPEGVNALQFFVDWWRKYKMLPDYGSYDQEQAEDLFYRQGVAMESGHNIMADRLPKEWPDVDFDVVMMPKGPAGAFSFADFGYVTISQACQYKDEAWQWVKFITSKDGAGAYLKNVGLFPARPDISIMEKNKAWPVYVNNMEKIRGAPMHPHFEEANNRMWAQIEAAILGQVTPKEAFATAEGDFNQALAG